MKIVATSIAEGSTSTEGALASRWSEPYRGGTPISATTVALATDSQRAGRRRFTARRAAAVVRLPKFHEPWAGFSRRFRRGWVIYVLVTLPIGAVIATRASTDEVSYLLAWARFSSLYIVPAVALTWVAARRAEPGARTFWRLWFAGIAAIALTGLALARVAEHDLLGLRSWGVVAVAADSLVLVIANLLFMRRRSGGRSLLLDAVETTIATVILCCLLVTAFGDRVIGSPEAWFIIPAGLALVGCIIGTVWALVLFQRTPIEHRRLEAIAVALGVVSIFNATGQVLQGASGFTLPPAPLLVLQASTMAILLLVPLHVSRAPTPGLERLPLHDQARGSRALTILVLVALPVMGIEAVLMQPKTGWAIANFAAVVAALLALTALRTLLALDETKRLYREIEAAAVERQRLLEALMRTTEDERHRFAAQLHQQALASYATFSSFIHRASLASPTGAGPLPEASARIRADLERNADAWRELMVAVRPLETRSGSVESLSTSIRAYVMNLFGDGARPELTIHADPGIELDWATEAIVLRIVQETIGNVRRHAAATHLSVGVSATAAGVQVRVADDGVGFDPEHVIAESGLATVRTFIELSSGSLAVDSARGRGTVVTAELGRRGGRGGRTPQLVLLRTVTEPTG